MTRLRTLYAPVVLAALAGATPAVADDLVVLDTQGQLSTFDLATGEAKRHRKVKGVTDDGRLESIDARPSNGKVYGLYRMELYELDVASGWARRVEPGSVSTLATPYALNSDMDFDPVHDVIRATRDSGSACQSFLIDPDTGNVTDVDGSTAVRPIRLDCRYDAADVNAGKTVGRMPIAFSNNVAGAQTTTLFGIDTHNHTLVRVGSPDGPTGGPADLVLTTIAPLGDAPGSQEIWAYDVANGFDIAADGTAYTQVMERNEETFVAQLALHRVDLSTGERSIVQRFPWYFPLDLTVVPSAVLSDEETFGVSKLSMRRDFAAYQNDTLLLTGTLPGFTAVAGEQRVQVQIGRGPSVEPAYREFHLDSRGRAKLDRDTFAFARKVKDGAAKFEMRLASADLTSMGIDSGSPDGTVTGHVDLFIGGRAFQADIDLTFRRTARGGVATFKQTK